MGYKELKKIKHSKLLKNGIWLFVLQVFNTIVPMITLPYVTRILGASGYGDFSLALNWILYFQVIVEYGFGYWGARKVATTGKEQLQNTFSRIITARIVLLLFSFIVMCIVYVFSGKEFSHFTCMCILFLMVLGVTFQLTWLFQGMQNMKFITMINAASRTISVLLIFALVKHAGDVYLYCFLYSCTYILSAVIGLYMANKMYRLKVILCDFKDAKSALIEAWPLFISQAMSKVLSGFGVTVLGMITTSSAVGIYSAIYKIPYTMALFFNPISQAIYPDISSAFSKSKKIGYTRVKKLAFAVVPLFTVAAVIFIVFHHPIVWLLFGNEYANNSIILVPLGVWFVLSVINNFLGIQILVASGHQKEYSNAFLISAICSVILYVILGNFWELYGIAFSTCIAELVLTILLLFYIREVYLENYDKTKNFKINI